MKRLLPLLVLPVALVLSGCRILSGDAACCEPTAKTLGSVQVLDPALRELLGPDPVMEVLASGFDWSEGPVWVPDVRRVTDRIPRGWSGGGFLLFSDVPSNTVYRWSAADGVSVFRRPSGYTGAVPRGGEPGSNGLTTDEEGRLVLCQHGDRRVGRLERDGRHVTLAERFDGKRFNSPNDVVFRSNGDLYFTDPPYGLVQNVDDPAKEIPFQGVYRVTPAGQVTLLVDSISRPNGLAFSPDEKTLYVACSDPKRAVWMAYDVRPDGTLANERVFFDATAMVGRENPGLPDGLKVDRKGNLFATGPGGVLIFSPAGRHLGTLRTGVPTANCAWGEDGRTLYITADMHLVRVRTRTAGRIP